MPVSVDIVDSDAESVERVFEYFRYVDETFSTYKPHSEISRINRGELLERDYSEDMRIIFAAAAKTKHDTDGYFDIKKPDGFVDPSGIVKGWAIHNAAELLRVRGRKHFYLEAGGDIATYGLNEHGESWRIGIRDPEHYEKIIKIVTPHEQGIATSGTAARGHHIWNPYTGTAATSPYLSISVIGPNVFEADRFATAAFAMGEQGMEFIERLSGFEAFAISKKRHAVKTSGFAQYEV